MIERALTNLLHDALDGEDVSGPFQRLQIELEKPGAANRRRGRRIFMTRDRLALLAAALVLLLALSVAISTRVLISPNRVGQTINAGPNPTVVAQLLARPLNLKHIAPGAPCPDGPYSVYGDDYGPGPVSDSGVATVENTSWGTYWDAHLYVQPGTQGPIVFRGQDVILGWPLVFLGSYGTGSVYGTDTVGGQQFNQYTAIVVDPAHPTKDWFWLFRQGFKHSWSGCVGFQADGPNFSETFYSAGTST